MRSTSLSRLVNSGIRTSPQTAPRVALPRTDAPGAEYRDPIPLVSVIEACPSLNKGNGTNLTGNQNRDIVGFDTMLCMPQLLTALFSQERRLSMTSFTMLDGWTVTSEKHL